MTTISETIADSGRAGVFSSQAVESGREARSGGRDRLRLLAGVVGAADAVLILAVSLLVLIVRRGVAVVPIDIFATSGLACLLTVNVLALSGAYRAHVEDALWPQIKHAAWAWSLVFLLLLTVDYASTAFRSYSWEWAMRWFVSVLLGLMMVRIAAGACLRHWRDRACCCRRLRLSIWLVVALQLRASSPATDLPISVCLACSALAMRQPPASTN